MTGSSADTHDLPEYETVIAGLVDELQQYKNAVTSLNDAVGASREIHARAKAVGAMIETVLSRADSVLAELQELDTPALIPRLSAMEGAISGLSNRIGDFEDGLASLATTMREAKSVAKETQEVVRSELPSTINNALQPLGAKVTRATYLVYGLLAGNVLLLILIIALR